MQAVKCRHFSDKIKPMYLNKINGGQRSYLMYESTGSFEYM